MMSMKKNLRYRWQGREDYEAAKKTLYIIFRKRGAENGGGGGGTREGSAKGDWKRFGKDKLA